MSESKKSLKHAMDEMIAEYGHGQPLLLLAGLVGWQAKWGNVEHSRKSSEACELIAKAAAIVLKIEEEETLAKLQEK